MELEVEEDLGPPLLDALDRGRPRGGEELRADLEAGDQALEPVHEPLGVRERLHVEGHDETISGVHALA